MKLTTIKLAASAPLLAIMLSACGLSDLARGEFDNARDELENVSDQLDNQAFEESNAKSKELAERLDDIGGPDAEGGYTNRTAFADVEAIGEASYTGLAEMWIKDDQSELGDSTADNETPDVIADLKLNAKFGDNAVTGSLSNWVVKYDPEVGPFTVNGVVDVDGDITPGSDGAEMSAGLSGTVDTTGDGPDETLTFIGNISGEFLGEGAEGAAGELNGTFSNPEDLDTTPTQMSGTWGAEKDAAAE